MFNMRGVMLLRIADDAHTLMTEGGLWKVVSASCSGHFQTGKGVSRLFDNLVNPAGTAKSDLV